NRGSPLVDIDTGQVLGVHFGAIFQPGPKGIERGQAISLFRLEGHPLLTEARVFGLSDGATARAPFTAQTFIDRVGEQRLFLDMLKDPRSKVLLVQGPPGVGKTALLQRFGEMAMKWGLSPLFFRSSLYRSSDEEDFLRLITEYDSSLIPSSDFARP